MPEMLEIEEYRLAADPVIGRTISAVHAPDEWYAKGATTPDALRAELPGLRITGTRRIGKLMLVDTDGPVLGLRYGMTGRILVDDTAPIAALEYSSDRNDPAWDRFGLDFAEGGSLVIRDPRRLGGVELDPDESRLGPDAAAITLKPFRAILTASSAPLKARLMDQAKIAGIGNLLADDMLYRSGLAPNRPANSLSDHEQAKLHRSMRRTIKVLGARGGSHTGDLQVERKRVGCAHDARRSSCVATMWGVAPPTGAPTVRPEPTSTGAPVTVTVRYGRRAMSGLHPVRSLLVALFVVGVLGFGSPVAAQVDGIDAENDVFDANETESTIDAIRYQLWGIAGITGALLVVYIWHTDPARRQRVADRRRSERERAAATALEDMFVLPGEIDDEQPVDTRRDSRFLHGARARLSRQGVVAGYGGGMSDSLDIDALLERFRERAEAVKRRNLPPVGGDERAAFVKQAQTDYMDYAMIGDAEGELADGILTLRIDLRSSDG